MEKALTDKPTILLCWGYNRMGWVEIFEKINPHFNFIYLFFYSKEQEDRSFVENKKIYYSDFNSPKKILEYVKPSKVIFMGFDSPLTIALNIAAKRKGITTYFMMHGTVSLNVEDYSARITATSKVNISKWFDFGKIRQLLFTFRFLISSLKLNQVNVFAQVLKFRYELQNKGLYINAFFKYQYPWRMPDKYIVFSNNDAAYYQKQDNAKLSDMLIIGNAESEPYFQYRDKNGDIKENYILYLETPISPVAAYPNDLNMISKERYNQLIEVMNNYAIKKGLRLIIKLHPYNYNETDYFQEENITYVTDADKVSLIMNATGVVGFDSSLLLIAVYFKNCCILINKQPNSFQKELTNAGFLSADIQSCEHFPDFLEQQVPDANRALIKEKFLERDKERFASPRATDNLVSILNN